VEMSSSTGMAANSFSAAAWFKTSSSADQKILSTGSSYHPLQTLNGHLQVCANGCSAGPTPISDDKWHFAIVVGDGTSIRAYLDGNQTPEITQALSFNDMSGKIRIGAAGAGTGADSPDLKFNGSIDEVRVYSRALTPDEIKLLYSNPSNILYVVDKPECAFSGGAVQSLTIPFVSNSNQEENSYYYATLRAWLSGASK